MFDRWVVRWSLVYATWEAVACTTKALPTITTLSADKWRPGTLLGRIGVIAIYWWLAEVFVHLLRERTR